MGKRKQKNLKELKGQLAWLRQERKNTFSKQGLNARTDPKGCPLLCTCMLWLLWHFYATHIHRSNNTHIQISIYTHTHRETHMHKKKKRKEKERESEKNSIFFLPSVLIQLSWGYSKSNSSHEQKVKNRFNIMWSWPLLLTLQFPSTHWEHQKAKACISEHV